MFFPPQLIRFLWIQQELNIQVGYLVHRSQIEFEFRINEGLLSAFEQADDLKLFSKCWVVNTANLIEQERFCINGIIEVAEGFKGIVVICLIDSLAKAFHSDTSEIVVLKEFAIAFESFVGINRLVDIIILATIQI